MVSFESEALHRQAIIASNDWKGRALGTNYIEPSTHVTPLLQSLCFRRMRFLFGEKIKCPIIAGGGSTQAKPDIAGVSDEEEAR